LQLFLVVAVVVLTEVVLMGDVFAKNWFGILFFDDCIILQLREPFFCRFSFICFPVFAQVLCH
jgi:hypothetical protein